MKYIYLATSYNTGVALPIEALEHLAFAKLCKAEGYNDHKIISTDPEARPQFFIIDAFDIDKRVRKDERLADALNDLKNNQMLVDRLIGEKS